MEIHSRNPLYIEVPCSTLGTCARIELKKLKSQSSLHRGSLFYHLRKIDLADEVLIRRNPLYIEVPCST